jgi:heme oxygenase
MKSLDKAQVEEAAESFDALFAESDQRQRARALTMDLRDAGSTVSCAAWSDGSRFRRHDRVLSRACARSLSTATEPSVSVQSS